ncbi:MAG: lysophospholipid acyltransferase family protein [Gammaproteobacteria bacterium]
MLGISSEHVTILRRSVRAARIAAHLIYGLLLACVLWIIAATLPQKYLRIRARWVRRWLSSAVSILGIRISVAGHLPVQNALFVANHISWLDILAMAAVTEGDFIAKQEVREWPLLGWLVSQGGTLFVRRGHAIACKRIIEETAFRLKSGRNVILFPEGTTTTGAQVLPFKPLLLRAAVLAQMPVQPVALRYEIPSGHQERAAFVGEMGFVSHLWKVMGLRDIRLHISFTRPLAVIGTTERQLAEAASQAVADKLGIAAESRRATAA